MHYFGIELVSLDETSVFRSCLYELRVPCICISVTYVFEKSDTEYETQ